MQAVAITDWHFTPPAFGLGLQRSHDARGTVSRTMERILQECVVPAVEASTGPAFLDEITRRILLFSVLRTKLLESLLEEIGTLELDAIHKEFAVLGAEVRSWAERLDEVSRAELDFAVTKLGQSNEMLFSAISQGRPLDVSCVPDLFKSAVVVEFLFFCLFHLAERGIKPNTVQQMVNSFRYAALDYAAAVRRFVSPGQDPEANDAAQADAAEVDDTSEDSFWALAASLPLVHAEE